MGTDITDPTLNNVVYLKAMLDSHMKTFMACLHKMKENDVMTDVTLKLPDGSSVSCHKIVLMASSPFFEVMFESEFKESTTQDIPLDFADAVTIKTLVEFFYSGEIDVCDDNVQTLVAASEFLCMKDLKDHCDAFMATRVDTSNCIELRRFGKKFNLMRLSSAAREFILLNFKDVVKCFSDFPTLTENELIEVVSSDELNAENEDLVFSAVVRWVNHDADERKEAFSRVAPLIRFPFCTHETLNDAIFVVGGKERSLFSYEPAKDTWTVLSPTQHAYEYCSATAWKGKILVMGRDHAEEYDVEGDTWIPMDKLVPGQTYSCNADNFILRTFLI
ncbi:hypothetical protein CAPTEDRAFT_207879 [Capitella teleta]|uniref:BTB domain-containing protein n=1 Tax=Capitella teleta TaxID=283909 RepID=R7UDY6_CAPTE|nr:hypothetical protein CAPTEDRAFT_207879 [Capitella teleta]|eukprot:ELU04204.1 hypothetical protein CAPTEDRAFT_207879 [Capitella teleta]